MAKFGWRNTTLFNAVIDADLNSISNIDNDEIKAAAGINFSKMEALTINRALVSDGSGFVAVSSVTSTELGYVSGVSSAIQTQLDGKASTSHASTHIQSGSDEVDGDKLDIDWDPSNYTPATTPSEVDDVDQLSAHLYGIDQALGAISSDDDKIKISSNDSTPNFLLSKVASSDSTISFAEVNDGGDEDLSITVNQSNIDHGSLNAASLADDDHTQYHTDARGDARYYTETELDAGQLDNRYYTETELDAGQLDSQYFQESEFLASSAGAGDAGKPIKLDASGMIDPSMVDFSDIDHGQLEASSLNDDDHSQYALLAGRSGGQTMQGGSDASDDLELESTSNATKGSVVVKSGSDFERNRKVFQDASATTTTATPADLFDIALDDDSVYKMKVDVVARRQDSAARAAYSLEFLVYRESAGSATLQGSVKQDFQQESDSNWDADVSVSGNNVKVQVTGIASSDIDWIGSLEFMKVSSL